MLGNVRNKSAEELSLRIWLAYARLIEATCKREIFFAVTEQQQHLGAMMRVVTAHIEKQQAAADQVITLLRTEVRVRVTRLPWLSRCILQRVSFHRMLHVCIVYHVARCMVHVACCISCMVHVASRMRWRTKPPCCCAPPEAAGYQHRLPLTVTRTMAGGLDALRCHVHSLTLFDGIESAIGYSTVPATTGSSERPTAVRAAHCFEPLTGSLVAYNCRWACASTDQQQHHTA